MAQSAQQVEQTLAVNEPMPIVVVGNGPAGMRAVQELRERMPAVPVIVYGDEPHQPYNRVRLSSWLAGELNWEELSQPLGSNTAGVEERIGYRVEEVAPASHYVIDSSGRLQPYRQLILATGSRAYIPNIPGVHLNGVFTFRDLDDANALLARQARSHHTLVLGGGLLGLEAARGMQRLGTQVTVIDHANRILPHQLDERGSAMLRASLEQLGISILLDSGVSEVLGDTRVRAVRLRDGSELVCDTLILATGIRPNVALARDARLSYTRGIRVDDQMCTSDPDIYAVGECAEHRGKVYGLVAPGLEQAAVAASSISGKSGRYQGSIAASRLKVVGTQVFSMGPMGDDAVRNLGRSYTWVDHAKGIYRRILVHRYRLIGALGIGDWPETVRLQTHIGSNGLVMPWQILRFVSSGMLWPAADEQGVAAWPASAVVCQCTGVTRGQISEAVNLGASCSADVSKATGASTVCGSCRPLVNQMLGNKAPAKAVPFVKSLLGLSLLSLIAAVLAGFAPAWSYADSVQGGWHLGSWWRDGLIKQISGFSILGMFVFGLGVSLRKRWSKTRNWGVFDNWRLAHLAFGALVIVALLAHTGFRAGYGLNMALSVTFVALLLSGSVSGLLIALNHKLDAVAGARWRKQLMWWHILLFWPVPILLSWHVLKGYWF